MPGRCENFAVYQVTGVTYNWTAPAGTSISSGQGTGQVTVSFNSAFTSQDILSVTAGNSCGTSAARTLTIYPNILSAPGAISGAATVCSNTVHTYSIVPVAGAIAYAWTVPAGSTIQGASNGTSIQVVSGSANGNITVRAVNACGNSSARSLAVTVSCAGMPEFSSASKATVYPNPADKEIVVQFGAPDVAGYTISIIDITGKAIIKRSMLSSVGVNQYRFDVSRLSKGAYIIIIQGKEGKRPLRLNVE